MNDNAKKWVEALRSGKYKQGKERLHLRDEYCCLGVACVLAVEAGVDIDVKILPSGLISYDGWNQILPRVIQDWLELNSATGIHTKEKDTTDLTRYNDNGKTFSEIADIIESEPEGLFKPCPPSP